jgi:aspartate oxidase
VFVGDHCEDEEDELVQLAGKLREKQIPLFMFHECADYDERSLLAKPVFRRMAEMTGGVYVEFKPDSGDVLRELLPTVAAFSAAGAEGVERIAMPVTPEARQLRSRLLLSSGDNGR